MSRARSDIDPLGVRRRICGLMAQGHSAALIAKAAGVGTHQQIFGMLASGSVAPRTAGKILTATRRLGGTEGPSTASRNHAARNGWPPLYAWMPGAIDNPQAQPLPWRGVDRVAIERAIQAVRAGRCVPAKLSRAESQIVAVKLAAAPYLMHDGAIADGMHKSYSWVRTTRERAGVPRVVVRAAPGRRAA
jgi:hypothetical protein